MQPGFKLGDLGWWCSTVVGHLRGIVEVLCSIPSTHTKTPQMKTTVRDGLQSPLVLSWDMGCYRVPQCQRLIFLLLCDSSQATNQINWWLSMLEGREESVLGNGETQEPGE
jgi:hypothetical protein